MSVREVTVGNKIRKRVQTHKKIVWIMRTIKSLKRQCFISSLKKTNSEIL